MEALSDVLSSKKWDLPTQNPTFAIGLSFIFLAYFLHPRIESAYQRVRASRAWRAVQKHKRVDVTDYPVLSEAFGVRSSRWDAPRTVTVLLAAFSLGSWILELSLEIYHVKGEAYLLTTPPPVYKFPQGSENLTWQVKGVMNGMPTGTVQVAFFLILLSFLAGGPSACLRSIRQKIDEWFADVCCSRSRPVSDKAVHCASPCFIGEGDAVCSTLLANPTAKAPYPFPLPFAFSVSAQVFQGLDESVASMYVPRFEAQAGHILVFAR